MRTILDFEPGYISCCDCGAKPEDPWDTDPEGFSECPESGEWVCEHCALRYVKGTMP